MASRKRPWCVAVDGRVVARKESKAAAERAAEELDASLRAARFGENVRALVFRKPAASQRQSAGGDK